MDEIQGKTISKSHQHLILIGILLFAATLRIYYFAGIDFDGSMYTLEAKNILEGIYNPFDLNYHNQGVRYTILIPIALSFKLFGISEWSAILPVFLASIFQIILVYLLGKKMFNVHMGLLAAFLLAIFPLDVNNATILEADLILSFTCLFSFLCYYRGVQKNTHLFIFFSGIIIGVSIFIKVFAGLFLLIIVFADFILYSQEKRLQRFMYLSLGIIVGIAPFIIYLTITTGNPLYFYTIEKEVNTFLLQSNILDYNEYISRIFLIQTYHEPPMLSIYFILAIIASIYYLYKRKPETSVLLAWLWIPFLILELIPTLPKVQRYLLFVEIPCIILISYGIIDFYYSSFLYKFKKSIICLLFIGIITICFTQYGGYYSFSTPLTYNNISMKHEEQYIYFALKDLPEKDIYITHYNMLPLLSFYFKYTKNATELYGYHGATGTSFYDLHIINNSLHLDDNYVILDARSIFSDTDIYHLYPSSESYGLEYAFSSYNLWHPITLLRNQTGQAFLALFYTGDNPEIITQIEKNKERE